MIKAGLKGCLIFFSVNSKPIDANNILDIQRHLINWK